MECGETENERGQFWLHIYTFRLHAREQVINAPIHQCSERGYIPRDLDAAVDRETQWKVAKLMRRAKWQIDIGPILWFRVSSSPGVRSRSAEDTWV
jgi:hypothetical protein